MKCIVLSFLVLTTTGAALAEPERSQPSDDILAKYFQAVSTQREAQSDLTMDVLMDAKLPKMKKEGRMSALRNISAIGKISYKVLGFWGDDTVKREVMARFMTAETQTRDDKSESVAINEENYKFKYKGLKENLTGRVHVFELKPRRKRVGLFKGELWIDSETYLPVRETGQLVKNPSIFIKKMEFVRDFEIKDGMAILRRFEGKTDTRIAGKAELVIEYANIQKAATAEPIPTESWAQAPVRQD